MRGAAFLAALLFVAASIVLVFAKRIPEATWAMAVACYCRVMYVGYMTQERQ